MESINLEARLSTSHLQGIPRTANRIAAADAGPGKAIESFGQALKEHLNQVNALDEQAEQLKEAYAVGKPVELHTVMIADAKADLAMEFTMQLRNKAISAYQNVWQMGI